ncbi:MAG: DUF5131 family protein [Mycobacterium sp.]
MSRIEWTDQAISVVDGCSPISTGCKHCYAARFRGTRHKHLTTAVCDASGLLLPNRELVDIKMSGDRRRYQFNGRVALNLKKLEAVLSLPYGGGKKGRRIFWNHMSDTFHERLALVEVAAQFAVMNMRRDLQFFVLTKRPRRAKEFFDTWAGCLAEAFELAAGRRLSISTYLRQRIKRMEARARFDNIAIGVTAENQAAWNERIPILATLPGGMRFVSAEPLLGPIVTHPRDWILRGHIAQIIIGAESGPNARPTEMAWIRSLIQQASDAGAAVFMKQAAVCKTCDGFGLLMLRRGGACRDRQFNGICGSSSCKICERLLQCDRCDSGRIGKTRKGCPPIALNARDAARGYAEFPSGWGPR